MTRKTDTSTESARAGDRSRDLPSDQATPVHRDAPGQGDADRKGLENNETLNPFKKEFWESGHEPGDEILPHLKWLAIFMAITVVVGIFAVFMGY